MCWIICAKEITLPLFFASSSGFISRWAAGVLDLTGDVFALGLLGLQGCSADHCRPSDLSGVPCIGLGFPSKDSFCCSGLLPSVRKHQIMTVKWYTENTDEKVMGKCQEFCFCFHVGNNALRCKQWRNCFNRISRRFEDILEIEPCTGSWKTWVGVLALVVTYTVALGQPPHISALVSSLMMKVIRRRRGFWVFFSPHSVKV